MIIQTDSIVSLGNYNRAIMPGDAFDREGVKHLKGKVRCWFVWFVDLPEQRCSNPDTRSYQWCGLLGAGTDAC